MWMYSQQKDFKFSIKSLSKLRAIKQQQSNTTDRVIISRDNLIIQEILNFIVIVNTDADVLC